MSYSSTILADTPKAYYRLNESSGTIAHDSSGNGYDAVIQGSCTYSQTGAISGDSDTSMSFVTSSTLQLPSVLNYTSWTAITLEFWINVGSGWQYTVVTYDGTTVAAYINGSAASTVQTSSVEVGTLFDFFGSYVAGGLDEVAVYNSALSSSKVASHWSAASSSGGPVLSHVSSPLNLSQISTSSSTSGAITFKNTGTGTLTWTASVSSGWPGITLGSTSGSVSAGGTGSIPVTATSGAGDLGNFSATVSLATNGGSQSVTVNVTVINTTGKLLLAVNGSYVTAAIINQVVNVLKQQSGGQEGGHYYCGGNSYATIGRVAAFVRSISRYATPVSVSLDQSDQSYTSAGSLSTDALTSGGFHVWIQATGAAGNVSTGGAYTLQY